MDLQQVGKLINKEALASLCVTKRYRVYAIFQGAKPTSEEWRDISKALKVLGSHIRSAMPEKIIA